MKKSFKFILSFSIVFFALFASSCKKDKVENLVPHQKMKMVDFYNAYKQVEVGSLQILDYRKAADFAAGYIPGAKNYEATEQNTNGNNAPFCQFVKENFTTTKPIFLYGNSGDNLYFGNFVPGRVSLLGFDYQNTVFLMDGMEAWKNIVGAPIATLP
jgi:3-mercaptopyruvate sulfurtransferase SseA